MSIWWNETMREWGEEHDPKIHGYRISCRIYLGRGWHIGFGWPLRVAQLLRLKQ